MFLGRYVELESTFRCFEQLPFCLVIKPKMPTLLLHHYLNLGGWLIIFHYSALGNFVAMSSKCKLAKNPRFVSTLETHVKTFSDTKNVRVTRITDNLT